MDSSVSPKDNLVSARVSSHFKRSLHCIVVSVSAVLNLRVLFSAVYLFSGERRSIHLIQFAVGMIMDYETEKAVWGGKGGRRGFVTY